jgi:hypothetical protein
MFTVILAMINSKYQTGYDSLFFGTCIIDVVMWIALASIFGGS